MQVRYDLVTGEIDQWGELCEPQEGKAIIDGVNPDILDVVSLAGRVLNGQLVLDEAIVQAIRSPSEPS